MRAHRRALRTAKSQFQNAGVLVDSEAQVLRAAKMVKLDWQRSVLAPGLLSCLRSYLGKSAPASARVHAIQKLAFPRLAQYTAAFRLAIDVTTQGTTLRMLLDFLLVGKGRTEVTLTTVAPYQASGAIKSAEVRLARLLVSRIRA